MYFHETLRKYKASADDMQETRTITPSAFWLVFSPFVICSISKCAVSITLKQLIFKKYFFLTRELSLINTCCWRTDHEMLMHDGGAGVH